MSDQDWTPVVLSKTNKQKTAGMNSAQVIRTARLTGSVTTEKKFGKFLNDDDSLFVILATIDNESCYVFECNSQVLLKTKLQELVI
jgi:hypothetical protein